MNFLTNHYFLRPVVFAFGSQDVFTANFVMSTLPPDDESQNNEINMNIRNTHRKQENNATLRNQSTANLTRRLSDVINLDADDDVVPVPAIQATPTVSQSNPLHREKEIEAITLATTVVSQSNPFTSTIRNCRSDVNRWPATLATTVVATNTLHNDKDIRDRSRSPIQSTNTPVVSKGTESEEICVTFRDESPAPNSDDEMEIPASPKPDRRRIFRKFPRLHRQTQYAENLSGKVLAEMTDDEI